MMLPCFSGGLVTEITPPIPPFLFQFSCDGPNHLGHDREVMSHRFATTWECEGQQKVFGALDQLRYGSRIALGWSNFGFVK